MELKPGMKLFSPVSTTQVIIVKAPSGDVDLRCGGQPMQDDGSTTVGDLDPSHSGGTELGKRYADDSLGLEVLCTKAGEGSLSIGEEPLLQKDAKPLPASD